MCEVPDSGLPPNGTLEQRANMRMLRPSLWRNQSCSVSSVFCSCLLCFEVKCYIKVP